ncbi:MAG: non-homologous end-joining DNA ligase [Tepidiformaceae bacterium]
MPRGLDTYRKMRDFERTPEPSGDPAPPAGDAPRFVIQEHHATALHWDFRLEHEGVLASWALPKGLPLDPRQNHLAVQTEDHPLEYASFEGDIPKGEYGGGRVILWDTGTYELHKFRDEEVMITLHGTRASGKYVLFRTGGKNWMIHRMDPAPDPTREPLPARVQPMLAKMSKKVPQDDANWAYEVKWDGIRAIYYASAGRARIESRNLLDLTPQYPELRGLADSLASNEFVLDGEIVAFDSSGKPSFGRLQERMGLKSDSVIRRRMGTHPVVYIAFDLLFFDGHSTMTLPYTERRRLLESLALSGPAWQTPAYHAGDGGVLLEASRAQQLEGIMAKRLDSAYEPGKRSSSWLKIKNKLSQEFVVVGWLPGEGARAASFGALLIATYDPTDPARLLYAGRVGSGFTDETLASLLRQLEALRTGESPVAEPPSERNAVWVSPSLVVTVEFTEWTADGVLRHPVFKGQRPDVAPAQVTREDFASDL